MSEELGKPLGWRPYSDDARNNLRATGFKEEQIDEMERLNIYAPPEIAVQGFHLAATMFSVLSDTLGQDFRLAVKAKLESSAGEMEVSGDSEDAVEAVHIRSLIDMVDWVRITATS